ncbi:MAG: hypothetical protein QOE14_2013, partial [Humisphaera sp.]|nr:hypothetical protein [Humisphaera sp.]
MSAKAAGGGLCCVNGRYRRTVGRFVNTQGKIAPKKFLLGTDKRAAQLANLRLEQLWLDITRAVAEEDAERMVMHERWMCALAAENATVPPSTAPRPRDPLWDEEALAIAEQIRVGAPHIIVAASDDPDATDACYVNEVACLRRRYPSVSFVPKDPTLFQRGQESFRYEVAQHTARAAAAAGIAALPLPMDQGQTLHAAIDDYARWVRDTKVKGGKLTAWGKVLSEQVQRLKDAHSDVPLSSLDYNALEKMKVYWTSRPASKRYGKPLALDTVRTQLSATRMFVK